MRRLPVLAYHSDGEQGERMYRILMVEDDEREAETLRHSLERYARENNLEFQVSWERSALGATSGDAKFDLIFLDIGLP